MHLGVINYIQIVKDGSFSEYKAGRRTLKRHAKVFKKEYHPCIPSQYVTWEEQRNGGYDNNSSLTA